MGADAHIFSPMFNSLQSGARSATKLAQFPPKSAQSSLPTKDDISSVLNRQRAHRTLCRAVIKKASSGKKPQ